MPHSLPRKLFATSVLLVVLAACDMPFEPEGIHEEGLTRLGERMQMQGDDMGAADLYQRALQRKPDDVQALSRLGSILETHGNVEMAETYYAHALKVDPSNQGVLQSEGRVLIRLGRAAEARDVFNKILEDNKHDVKARNGLGIALDYLGQHDEAQKAYRAALDDAADDVVTMNNLAHSYVLSGHYDQAIAVLEPHVKDKNATSALRQNLAEAYGLSGMYVDAERLARMDLKPDVVKRNLAFYRARRSKLALEPRLIANFGSYPTKGLADVAADKVRSVSADKAINVVSKPEIQSIGGTPSFVVEATGFKDAAALNKFCEDTAKAGLSCSEKKAP